MAEEATPGSVGRGINNTKQVLAFLCYFSERRNNIIILNNLDSEKKMTLSLEDAQRLSGQQMPALLRLSLGPGQSHWSRTQEKHAEPLRGV